MHPLVTVPSGQLYFQSFPRLKQIVCYVCVCVRHIGNAFTGSYLQKVNNDLFYLSGTGQRQRDDARQFDIFFLSSDVQKGNRYYIEMNFTGPLTGDLVGLYLSQYQRNDQTMYVSVLN